MVYLPGIQLHEGGTQSLHSGVDLADRLEQVGGVSVNINDGRAIGLSGVGAGCLPAEVGDLLQAVGKIHPYLIPDGIGIRAVDPGLPGHGLNVVCTRHAQLPGQCHVVIQLGVQQLLIAGSAGEDIGIVHHIVQDPAAVLLQLPVQPPDIVRIGTAEVDVGHGIGHDALDQSHGMSKGSCRTGFIHDVVPHHAGDMGVALGERQDLRIRLGRPGTAVEAGLADRHIQPPLVGKGNGLQVVLVGDGCRIQGKVHFHIGDAPGLEVIKHRGVDVLLEEVGNEGHDLEVIRHPEVVHQHMAGVDIATCFVCHQNVSLPAGLRMDGAVRIHRDYGLISALVGHHRGGQAFIGVQAEPIRLPRVHTQGGLVQCHRHHILPVFISVYLHLAKGGQATAGSVLYPSLTGDVQTDIPGLHRVKLVGASLHRHIGRQLILSLWHAGIRPGLRGNCLPLRPIQGHLDLKVLGEGPAIGPLHGLEHHLLHSAERAQRDDQIQCIILRQRHIRVGVPAQADVISLQAQPLPVRQEGQIVKALRRGIAVRTFCHHIQSQVDRLSPGQKPGKGSPDGILRQTVILTGGVAILQQGTGGGHGIPQNRHGGEGVSSCIHCLCLPDGGSQIIRCHDLDSAPYLPLAQGGVVHTGTGAFHIVTAQGNMDPGVPQGHLLKGVDPGLYLGVTGSGGINVRFGGHRRPCLSVRGHL